MKLTVIIAGFRTAGVKEAINDLDRQTDQDLEVIIVNDGQEELRAQRPELIKGRPNYHFIDNHTRCHYYGAISRNMAVLMAFMYIREHLRDESAEYVMFHDDDVEFSPTLIEDIKNKYKENNKLAMICPGITEIRGKINKDYVHRRKTRITPQNVDLNGMAFHKKTFIKYGCLPASPRFKITYDWELIKSIYEGEGKDCVNFTENSHLIFNHKRR